ncbi:MAG: DUF1553 domain-containing protein, partial [Planctomycetota bacterium]
SRIDFTAGRRWWSFQPPRRQTPPRPATDGWEVRPLDAFVADAFHARGLVAADRAQPLILLRRLTFDLTGLPPTLAQQSAVELLQTQAGYEQFVDGLLQSPAFGEHWARLWLDLMRFAEDQAHIVGNNRSLFYPNAYLYRDWVVGAFNSDLPYDQFVKLQLAADLITPDDPTDDVALGFIGLGPKYYRRNAPEVMADEWEDRVDVLSRGLLGLTVACARCHDHKYDPIGTADYYALAGVFASTEMFNRPLSAEVEVGKDGQAKDPVHALHIVRDIAPRDLHIMIRGDVNRTGPLVPRGFLTVLSSSSSVRFQQGSGRAELAEILTDPARNPLLARVFVNRIWGRLMGRPLVATPSNFGSLGTPPSHPELLDDLSVRFMEHDWSVKWLCREIVTSATYQQSAVNAATQSADPTNIWLTRANRKRLSVEQWRDAVLAAADRLECTNGGPSIDPADPESTRRTLYSQASRLELNRMLALFDYPDPNNHAPARATTTTPSQKLFLMNSPFMARNAERIAERVRSQSDSVAETVEAAFRLLLGRPPSAEETQAAIEYLQPDGGNLPQLVHGILLTNEMYFID